MKRRKLEIYDDARIVAERHREKGRDEGAAEERAKIVEYLRETIFNCTLADIPSAIEAGEHLK